MIEQPHGIKRLLALLALAAAVFSHAVTEASTTVSPTAVSAETKVAETDFQQVNDSALKAFLQNRFLEDQSQPPDFDRFDAEVWLERTLSTMRKFRLEQQTAIEILSAVYRESYRNRLAPDLVLAVIEIESFFDRYAVSRVGAQGLMQVMPFWKEEIGRSSDNLIDIDTNIRYGCYILAYYLKIADGRWAEALARYNGSYGRTVYSEKVLTRWQKRWRGASIDWTGHGSASQNNP